MPTDREALIQSLGGEAKVAAMSHEQRADALEEFEMAKLDAVTEERRRKEKFPTVAELEASVAERTLRRGAGTIFQPEKGFREDPKPGARGKILPEMPEKPTLFDFFTYRLGPAAHLKQSAALAKRTGTGLALSIGAQLLGLGQMGDLAARAGLSRSAMSARFESVLGTSPMRYVRDWQIGRAHV